MFTFHEHYEFDWPVEVVYPSVEGEVKAVFNARFKLVDEDDLFLRREDRPRDFHEAIADERKALAERWIGWTGIQTPDGRELAFTPSARDRLLRQAPIRRAVASAYMEAVMTGKVTEKN